VREPGELALGVVVIDERGVGEVFNVPTTVFDLLLLSNYRREDNKISVSLDGSWLPLVRKQRSSPKEKRPFDPRGAFRDTTFEPSFRTV
jgi:hypothetical protein